MNDVEWFNDLKNMELLLYRKSQDDDDETLKQ